MQRWCQIEAVKVVHLDECAAVFISDWLKKLFIHSHTWYCSDKTIQSCEKVLERNTGDLAVRHHFRSVWLKWCSSRSNAYLSEHPSSSPSLLSGAVYSPCAVGTMVTAKWCTEGGCRPVGGRPAGVHSDFNFSTLISLNQCLSVILVVMRIHGHWSCFGLAI